MLTPILKTTTMMMMTIMVMKNKAEVKEVLASTGGSVLLNSEQQTGQHYEARWTHKNLLVYSGATSACDGGCCELLPGGSLRLHCVTRHYAGNYKLELFNSDGKLMATKEFLLRVDGKYAAGTTTKTQEEARLPSQSAAGRNAAICCSLLLLLLLVFITVLILRRRWVKRCPTSDQSGQTDGVYVVMHQSKISKKEEEDVRCHPDVSTETDVYV